MRNAKRTVKLLPYALVILTLAAGCDTDIGDQQAASSQQRLPTARGDVPTGQPCYDSGELSPFGTLNGNPNPQSFYLAPAALAEDGRPVILTFQAKADLETQNQNHPKYVDVVLNNNYFDKIFCDQPECGALGRDCADPPDEATLAVPAELWNQLVAGYGYTMEITMTPTPEVNAQQCAGNSFISVHVDIGIGGDCNADGISNACEIFTGAALDCNGNGQPDACDLDQGLSRDINNTGIPDECELAIDAVEPRQGLVNGGTLVRIHGYGFTPASKVRFDNLLAAEIDVVDHTLINAVTPAHGPGLVEVSVEAGGASPLVARNPGGFTYIGIDDATDTDGDGLTDYQELEGWEVWVDLFGFGFGTDTFGNISGLYTVTSDPFDPDGDTDDDGLTDLEEFIIGSDPRMYDTDEDGLTDEEEWNRWLTSPISIDSDGDSRGPAGDLAPNGFLFDGEELFQTADLDLPADPSARLDFLTQRRIRPGATSPTLDDTDGDGATDFEEIDDPVRSPLVADLPQFRVEVVDDVDVVLNVEYAEEEGSGHEYGSTFSTSTTDSQSQSQTFSSSILVGNEGLKFKSEFTVGQEHQWSWGTETTVGSDYSELVSDSRSHTETASTGNITMGVRVSNPGILTYRLTQLGFTVRQWLPGADQNEPDAPGALKTVAKLSTDLGDGITLAPGGRSSVLPTQALNVNADQIKKFLAKPTSLFIEPATFELENAEGINFNFLEEVTLPRTAQVTIDFGEGRTESYRIATNVDRQADGEYPGISMDHVMNALQIPYEGPQNLTRVREVETQLTPDFPLHSSFWVVLIDGVQAPDGNFGEIRIQNGETVSLVYTQDLDGDGLIAALERNYGTSDINSPDSDGDDLPDGFEALQGWTVTVNGNTIDVLSSPNETDADRDGLDDSLERDKGTDPNSSDTDLDGVNDLDDPYPTIRARTLYVDAAAGPGGDGASWSAALDSPFSATEKANDGYLTPSPDDDVGEIWVAEGEYVGPFQVVLVPNLTVYGGFTGTETKLAQRNADPLTNGTVLTPPDLNYWIVYAKGGTLDGFRLQGLFSLGNHSTAVYIPPNEHATIRNCIFADHLYQYEQLNEVSTGGAAIQMFGGSTATIEGCIFDHNQSNGNLIGGAVYADHAHPVFVDCIFTDNQLRNVTNPLLDVVRGGGAVGARGGSPEFRGCRFLGNFATSDGQTEHPVNGGGVLLTEGATGRFTDCIFQSNEAINVTGVSMRASTMGSPVFDEGRMKWAVGGAVSMHGGDHLFLNCLLSGNAADVQGGALYVDESAATHLINCTVVQNQARAFFLERQDTGLELQVRYHFSVGGAIASAGEVFTRNSIIYWNSGQYDFQVYDLEDLEFGDPQYLVEEASVEFQVCPAVSITEWPFDFILPPPDITDPISALDIFPVLSWQGVAYLSHSSVQNVRSEPWSAGVTALGLHVIAADPALDGLGRPASTSPCVDAGKKLVDADPLLHGFQPLPLLDLAGGFRVTDGNGDGFEQVDMGAFELQTGG